jgi:hypothetical protein
VNLCDNIETGQLQTDTRNEGPTASTTHAVELPKQRRRTKKRTDDVRLTCRLTPGTELASLDVVEVGCTKEYTVPLISSAELEGSAGHPPALEVIETNAKKRSRKKVVDSPTDELDTAETVSLKTRKRTRTKAVIKQEENVVVMSVAEHQSESRSGEADQAERTVKAKRATRTSRKKATTEAAGTGYSPLIFMHATLISSLDEVVPGQPSSPLALEILENLAKFPHCILLTRVGQFYEVSKY